MKDYRITFWTPGHRPAGEDLFGCASLGIFAPGKWLEPDSEEIVCWKTVKADALSGTYAQMLERADPRVQSPDCILCFFTGGEGNDDFVDALQEKFPSVPIVGGTAARLPEQKAGEVLPAGQDGAILLVYDRPGVCADFCLTHQDVVAQVSCEIENKRDIIRIDGQKAMSYYNARRAEFGKETSDFESMTFHEACGKNVHCCAGTNGLLHAGADIRTQTLTVSQTTKQQATETMQRYLPAKNSLSIGCAGIKTLLQTPIQAEEENVGVFLFGEVVRFDDGRSRFCNLMLGRLHL